MPHLLEEENRVVWAVDQVLNDAALDPGILGRGHDRDWAAALYAAETRKEEACRSVYNRVQQRVDQVYETGAYSFAARLWSDLSLLVTLLVPIASVERCAAAQRNYGRAYRDLQRHLEVQVGQSGRPSSGHDQN